MLRAEMRAYQLTALFMLASSVARPVSASDTCTIMYRVNASLEVTDTRFGKGDQVVDNLKGSLLVEYRQKDGAVVDGKVKILHYSMYESFKLETIVDVTTTIHHYTPRCGGVDEPSWRQPSDPGFPKSCRYSGQGRGVATGELNLEAGTITWGKCKAAPSYWAKGNKAYTPADKSKGKGCLSDMHVAGNIHCDGKLACKMGGLVSGDNPQFDVWNQPLIHGPPESESSVRVTSDLSTIRTPGEREDGYQSYNLPNDSPSRTWFGFAAKRNDSSSFTTCP